MKTVDLKRNANLQPPRVTQNDRPADRSQTQTADPKIVGVTIGAARIDQLKDVYRIWKQSGGSHIDPWLEVARDDFRLISILDGARPVAYSKEVRGKAELIEFFQGLVGDWELMDFNINEMFGCDNRVVVLSRQAYQNRRTGKIADGSIAHIWRFRGSKAIELQVFLDTAKWLAAAQ